MALCTLTAAELICLGVTLGHAPKAWQAAAFLATEFVYAGLHVKPLSPLLSSQESRSETAFMRIFTNPAYFANETALLAIVALCSPIRQQVPVAVFLVHGIFHVGYTAITAVAKEWAIAQNNQRIEGGWDVSTLRGCWGVLLNALNFADFALHAWYACLLAGLLWPHPGLLLRHSGPLLLGALCVGYAAFHLIDSGLKGILEKRSGQRVLRDEVVLITGGSSGIGFETARLLHEAGAQVVITSPSIRSYQETCLGVEANFGVNHLGHFLLTELLLPHIVEKARASGMDARIVILTSTAMHWCKSEGIQQATVVLDDGARSRWSPWAAYGQAKLANILHAAELERRCKAAGLPISVVAIHPGLAATGLQRHMGWLGTLLKLVVQGVLSQQTSAAAERIFQAACMVLPCKHDLSYLDAGRQASPPHGGRSLITAMTYGIGDVLQAARVVEWNEDTLEASQAVKQALQQLREEAPNAYRIAYEGPEGPDDAKLIWQAVSNMPCGLEQPGSAFLPALSAPEQPNPIASSHPVAPKTAAAGLPSQSQLLDADQANSAPVTPSGSKPCSSQTKTSLAQEAAIRALISPSKPASIDLGTERVSHAASRLHEGAPSHLEASASFGDWLLATRRQSAAIPEQLPAAKAGAAAPQLISACNGPPSSQPRLTHPPSSGVVGPHPFLASGIDSPISSQPFLSHLVGQARRLALETKEQDAGIVELMTSSDDEDQSAIPLTTSPGHTIRPLPASSPATCRQGAGGRKRPAPHTTPQEGSPRAGKKRRVESGPGRSSVKPSHTMRVRLAPALALLRTTAANMTVHMAAEIPGFCRTIYGKLCIHSVATADVCQNLRERDQLVMAGGASLACWPVRAQSADRRCSEQGASARELLNLQCLLERSNWALYDRDCGEEYLADVDELWQSQPGYVPSPPASPAKLALPALVGGQTQGQSRQGRGQQGEVQSEFRAGVKHVRPSTGLPEPRRWASQLRAGTGQPGTHASTPYSPLAVSPPHAGQEGRQGQ
ncbi:hypothetical protein WJX84_003586 [Apatococcus fuscideae]|uniref:Uncharacterized protein n=1 Tax=Apatococcus fuscideae TaxID=2026836 RepID=A0AAW1T6R3_9CHLO